MINNREIVLIFDGFDEISPEVRNEAKQYIDDISNILNNSSFIITSRQITTNQLDNLKDNYRIFDIEPFDTERIVEYVKKWYKNVPLLEDGNRDIDAETLVTKWENDLTIKDLTSNPLLLSTLLNVHHLDGELPKGRSQLYDRYINGMLGIWDARRNIKRTDLSIRPLVRRKILRVIAVYMFLNDKITLDEGELLKFVDTVIDEMSLNCNSLDLLDLLRERSGLLIGPGLYSYVHKTVLEFFVAESIKESDLTDQYGSTLDQMMLFRNRHSDKWNVVLFLWAGLARIKDLENFTNDSIASDKYSSLAIGLLYDQKERFSRKQWNNLFKQSLQKDIKTIKGYNLVGGHINPWDLFPMKLINLLINKLEISMPVVRGLNEDDPRILVDNLEDIDHEWYDELSDYFKSIFIINNIFNLNVELWQKVFSDFPIRLNRNAISIIAFDSAIFLAKNKSKTDYIECWENEFSYFKNKKIEYLLILMNSLFTRLNRKDEYLDELISKTHKEKLKGDIYYLASILFENKDQFTFFNLEDSTKWQRYYSINSLPKENNIDILNETVESLRWVFRGEKNELIQESIKFIEKIMRQRDISKTAI